VLGVWESKAYFEAPLLQRLQQILADPMFAGKDEDDDDDRKPAGAASADDDTRKKSKSADAFAVDDDDDADAARKGSPIGDSPSASAASGKFSFEIGSRSRHY
jgi:hypothetical protein